MAVHLDVELSDQEWDDLATALTHARAAEARLARFAANDKQSDEHLIRAYRITRLARRLDREKQRTP